jgi:glycosyltransferase involved in cell wall biosynthesis
MLCVSYVIPVFNNASTIRETVEEITRQFHQSFKDLQLEIICINDGSTDLSRHVLDQLASKNNAVRTFSLSRNFGQLAATLCGLERARGDAVIVLSADLQDPIEVSMEMIANWKKGSEIVIAYRTKRNDGLFRTFTSRVAYFFAKREHPLMPSGGFDYYLLSSIATKALLQFSGRFRFLQSDILYLGYKLEFLPYTRRQSPNGKSGYNFFTRLEVFMDLILDSSYGLIKLISRIGVSVSFLGVIAAFILVANKYNSDTTYPGWTSLSVMILIMSGLIIFILGLITEYLWRIYDELRKKPIYLIDEKRE